MKRLLIISIGLILCSPTPIRAQNDGAIAAAAGALALGAAIASVENYKEQLELSATEWFLKEHGEVENFELRTLDLNGKKLKDMSLTSVITFKIQEFDPEKLPNNFYSAIDLGGKKWVLMAFTSPGWMNDYGVNISRMKWLLVDREEWLDMMVTYVMAASGVKDVEMVKRNVTDGKIVNKGIKNDGLVIPFYKTHNDMYLTADYNEEMKFVYNERSLGIYLKETQDLVQMSRDVVIDIHSYFFD